MDERSERRCEREHKRWASSLDESTRVFSRLDAYVAHLQHTIAERDAHISSLYEALAERDEGWAHLEGIIKELKSNLWETTAELVSLREDVARNDAEATRLRNEKNHLEAKLSSVYCSSSWRMTRPLRVLSRGLRFRSIRETSRRVLRFAGWFATGHFGRVGRVLLPHCRTLLSGTTSIIPRAARRAIRRREAVKRRLELGSRPEFKFAHMPIRQRVNQAAAAFGSGEWPQAVREWQDVLEECGSDEALMGIARMHLSISRRLAGVDECKMRVQEYINSRAGERNTETDKIAVFTAIAECYDSPKLPEMLEPRFDYLLFTDRAAPTTGVWQIRPMTFFHADPTRAARYVKTHPHTLLAEYDIAVWIDSNIMIIGDIGPLVSAFKASGKPVGAIPHPLRTSVFQEFEACKERNKDDEEILQKQISFYRMKGYASEGLIESNFMMFNLRDDRGRAMLDMWWAEIDRHSRRDQLSLPYVLERTGVPWYPLMERPRSARNHPALAFVPHDAGNGPAAKLIELLGSPPVDPYAGPAYADIRGDSIAAQRHRRIDIVVCVHNALDEVKCCLDSVDRMRSSDSQRLIIIDDGSEESTARYLEGFARARAWVELYRNEKPQGYTRAANRGLKVATGELVILLNSDTIVTEDWTEKMADAVFSTAGAGIVGPISNAASYQSIPEHRGSKGQTAINELPPGLSAEDMNRLCEQWTVAHIVPIVPLVHGFCFGITREVIDAIGLFDEESFPRGYGEENDYCFRASDAGFGLVIATHTFVYHAKTKSYTSNERAGLARAGMEALERLHGRRRVQRAVHTMQQNPILEKLRRRAEGLYSSPKAYD